MTKHHVLGIISIGGIIGVITGMVVASCYWLSFGNRYAQISTVDRTETSVVTKVALLEHLRSGRYRDAAMQLETLLDTDLIGAGALARNGVEFSTNMQSAVERERKARQLSGYEPVNSSVSAGVQEAFRLVPKTASWEHESPLVPPDGTR